MNIFRLIGDMAHLMSFLVILVKMQGTKSAAGACALPRSPLALAPSLPAASLALPRHRRAGISLKTQQLYLLVFLLCSVWGFANRVVSFSNHGPTSLTLDYFEVRLDGRG